MGSKYPPRAFWLFMKVPDTAYAMEARRGMNLEDRVPRRPFHVQILFFGDVCFLPRAMYNSPATEKWIIQSACILRRTPEEKAALHRGVPISQKTKRVQTGHPIPAKAWIRSAAQRKTGCPVHDPKSVMGYAGMPFHASTE